MKYVVVPIELVDYPLDSFTNKLREMFSDNVDNSDAELIYEYAIMSAAPDTGMIAVDKDALENAISRYLITSCRGHSIRNNVYGNGVFISNISLFPKEMVESIIQALKDMEGK